MFSLINLFKIVSFLEGISYILLLGIAVPIKYILHDPTYVKLLGMPHGILFIGYIILAIIVGSKLQWKGKTLFYVLIASVIPFGTFYINRTYLKQVS